jgi:hypothetical protein
MIRKMAAQWKTWSLLNLLIWSVAIALPLWMLGYIFLSPQSYSLVILIIVIFAILAGFNRPWRISVVDVAKFLDKTVPETEESTELLLAEHSSLLAQLQQARIDAALSQSHLPKPWLRKSGKALLFLLASVVITAGIYGLHTNNKQQTANSATASTRPEKKPEGVTDVVVKISPPAYTHKKTRSQAQFSITAEEGSIVNWTIETANAAEHLYFIWNDSLKLSLQPDKEHKSWTFTHKIDRPGFYQLIADSIASELYRVDMVHDESPTIIVHQPKPNTVIDYGMPRNTLLQAAISDDYGVQDAWIMATISSGKGESVKFREEQLRFANSFAAQSNSYALQRNIDLNALKMAPGDELYFYVLARDNGGHEKRSDIFLISIADTAQLMSLSGLTMGLDIKPDYFRSQRQIIIETEQLLREKDTVSAQRFKDRSNNLGIDQKLLRMRYGKFLGEENSEGGEGGGDDDHGGGDHADNNAASIQQAYSHNHDIAEDASFFADDIKSQLKATLAEMWNAELRLRTFKPQEALVYEYKALRLLKELQQKDRVYVAKTTVKTPPLKPEKRLTGELDKIQQPVWQAGLEIPRTDIDAIKTTIGQLEHLKTGNNQPAANKDAAFATAYKQLSNAAAAAPSTYLSALESMKRLMTAIREQQAPAQKDVVQTQQALQQLVAPGQPKPYRSTAPIQQPGRDYFKQLEQQKRS